MNPYPMNAAEMAERGWDAVDFIIVTGDAFVDHSSFGAAIIAGVLARRGFRVGIISQPTWGGISDWIRSVKRCFMLCMAGTALCALAVPGLSRGGGGWLPVLAVVLVVMYFFFHPSNMMMELWLVRVSSHPQLRIPYGSVRSWASVGYALFSLAFVPVTRAMHVRNVYYFFAGFAAPSCFALYFPASILSRR